MNRREFIKGAASFGFPMICSGCATAYRANETVQMAAIGCGGRPVADISGLEAAGAMTQCSLLGVAALFDPDRELQWDFANRRFRDSSAANARLACPACRGGDPRICRAFLYDGWQYGIIQIMNWTLPVF